MKITTTEAPPISSELFRVEIEEDTSGSLQKADANKWKLDNEPKLRDEV